MGELAHASFSPRFTRMYIFLFVDDGPGHQKPAALANKLAYAVHGTCTWYHIFFNTAE